MLDNVLMALADPTRRAILDRLVAGEARVTDVAAPFPMSLNAVSKHIQVLERAELIVRRRAGREHFLSRNARGLEEAAAWMAAERLKWNNAFDRLAKALENDT
jgi:DNA-binding transcriptional ArsR family regulator